MTYGKKLQQLRNDAGMSQKAFATHCGVSYETLCNHEQDEVRMSVDHLFAYVKGLGMECSAFKGCHFPKKDGRGKGKKPKR